MLYNITSKVYFLLIEITTKFYEVLKKVLEMMEMRNGRLAGLGKLER